MTNAVLLRPGARLTECTVHNCMGKGGSDEAEVSASFEQVEVSASHSRPPASVLVGGGLCAGSALSSGDRQVGNASQVNLGKPLLDLGRVDVRQLVERGVTSGRDLDCKSRKR